MKLIKSPQNSRLSTILIAVFCTLLVSGTSSRDSSNKRPTLERELLMKQQSDIYNEFRDFFKSNSLKRTSHLQTTVDSQITNVADSTNPDALVGSNANVVKVDETLGEDLFTTPDLSFSEQHSPDESEGYLQVLNAMRWNATGTETVAQPVQVPIVQPSGPNTKVIQTKTGLNLALLKILTLSKQFSENAKSAVTSDYITINTLTQNLAGELFANSYSPQNVTVVTTEATENKPSSAQITVDNGNGNVTVTTILGNTTLLKAENEINQENAQVSERLLQIAKMYSEHVENKDREIIADEGHYGHLKYFGAHLNCLVEKSCDIDRHLASFSSQSHKSQDQRHALEVYMAENRHFVHDQNSQEQTAIYDLLQVLPKMTSNEDIKRTSSEWIEKNHESLNQFSSNWPGYNSQIQSGIQNINSSLPLFKQITPEQFLGLLDQVSNQYKSQIDTEFTVGGLNNKTQELVNMRNGVVGLHASLKNILPVNGVLENDFNRLENKLENHINIFQKAQNATPEQLENARIYLKNNLQMNINGIDPVANSQLLQAVANNTDAILKSQFGKSLNKENLDFIIQKSINSLHVDFDQMKDGNKKSGFMLDQADLQKLTDNVVDELKDSREEGQKLVLDFTDLQKGIRAANKEYSANPNDSDPALNAANVLISYENGYYEALASDEFYDDLQSYIEKYYWIYHQHATQLEPFFQYSSAYKTLTNGLDNPANFGSVYRPAYRILMSTVKNQVDNLKHLTSMDKKFFNFMNHLIFEWAHEKNLKDFTHKLDSIILTVQGLKRSTDLQHVFGVSSSTPRKLSVSLHLTEIDEAHLQLAMFEQLKSSVMNVVNNIGTGVKGATGLSQTIGNAKGMVEQAASQYHVTDLLGAVNGNSNSGAASTSSGAAVPVEQNLGFFGKMKNKVKSWFGWRNLAVHEGFLDSPIESVKNLYKSIVTAKDQAENLKNNFDQAQGIANNVQGGIGVFSSIFKQL